MRDPPREPPWVRLRSVCYPTGSAAVSGTTNPGAAVSIESRGARPHGRRAARSRRRGGRWRSSRGQRRLPSRAAEGRAGGARRAPLPRLRADGPVLGARPSLLRDGFPHADRQRLGAGLPAVVRRDRRRPGLPPSGHHVARGGGSGGEPLGQRPPRAGPRCSGRSPDPRRSAGPGPGDGRRRRGAGRPRAGIRIRRRRLDDQCARQRGPGSRRHDRPARAGGGDPRRRRAGDRRPHDGRRDPYHRGGRLRGIVGAGPPRPARHRGTGRAQASPDVLLRPPDSTGIPG